MNIKIKARGFYNAYGIAKCIGLAKNQELSVIKTLENGDYLCDNKNQKNFWSEQITTKIIVEKENAIII